MAAVRTRQLRYHYTNCAGKCNFSAVLGDIMIVQYSAKFVCSEVQSSEVQCSAVEYSTVQCSAV